MTEQELLEIKEKLERDGVLDSEIINGVHIDDLIRLVDFALESYDPAAPSDSPGYTWVAEWDSSKQDKDDEPAVKRSRLNVLGNFMCHLLPLPKKDTK